MKNEAVGVDEDNFIECVPCVRMVCGLWQILDGLLSDCVTRVANVLFWIVLILSLQRVYL